MENEKDNDLYAWDKGFQQHDGVWYDSEFEYGLNNAVRSGDVKGASEALKDLKLVKSLFGEDAEKAKVLKKDINCGEKGMLCKVHSKEGNKLYFIAPYVYYGAWIDSDSYCAWVVIPTAG